MAIVVKSMATSGVDGFMVEIEASTIRGQQQSLSIIGLPDQAIKEAGERIQAAIESCGYDFPKDKSIISLAPGDKKKRGSHFDLGMIIALLFQTDQISPKNLAEYAFIGELSLDGRIRPCNGVLSMVTEARKCGVHITSSMKGGYKELKQSEQREEWYEKRLEREAGRGCII